MPQERCGGGSQHIAHLRSSSALGLNVCNRLLGLYFSMPTS